MSEADGEGVPDPTPRPQRGRDTTRWRRPIPQRTSSTTRGRQLGLDVARALALVGIMGNHLLGGGTYAAQATSQIMSDYHAVIFAVLIGCGVQLELDAARRHGNNPLRTVLVRCIFLIALGLGIASVTQHVAVILLTLGLLTIVAHFAARLPNPAFIAILTITYLAAPALTILNRAHGWTKQLLNAQLHHFADPINTTGSLLLADPYPFLVWTVYALAGIAYVRWIINRHTNLARTALASLVVFAVAKIAGRLLAPAGGILQQLTETTGYSGSYLNVVASAAVAIFIIATCSLVVKVVHRQSAANTKNLSLPRTWLAHEIIPTLAAVGQLTLTWYVAHLLVSDEMIPWLENLPPAWRYADFAMWAGQVLVIVAVSAWHRRHYRYGPLEAIPRKVASSWGNQTR